MKIGQTFPLFRELPPFFRPYRYKFNPRVFLGSKNQKWSTIRLSGVPTLRRDGVTGSEKHADPVPGQTARPSTGAQVQKNNGGEVTRFAPAIKQAAFQIRESARNSAAPHVRALVPALKTVSPPGGGSPAEDERLRKNTVGTAMTASRIATTWRQTSSAAVQPIAADMKKSPSDTRAPAAKRFGPATPLQASSEVDQLKGKASTYEAAGSLIKRSSISRARLSQNGMSSQAIARMRGNDGLLKLPALQTPAATADYGTTSQFPGKSLDEKSSVTSGVMKIGYAQGADPGHKPTGGNAGIADQHSGVVGELWLDTASLKIWLQSYLSSESRRATRSTNLAGTAPGTF